MYCVSLVNTDHFPRGWRLSIGDYKRPLVAVHANDTCFLLGKGLVNLAVTTCSADPIYRFCRLVLSGSKATKAHGVHAAHSRYSHILTYPLCHSDFPLIHLTPINNLQNLYISRTSRDCY